ncbi:MAG: T9SS type A sorting domain-containing protein [Syntrophothermus sp.]
MKKMIMVLWIMFTIYASAQTTIPQSTSLRDLYFQNEEIGFVYAYYQGNGRIYKTTNGGINWKLTFDPYSSIMKFVNDSVGYAYTFIYNSQNNRRNKFSKTTDKGETWQNIFETQLDFGEWSSADFVNENVGYAFIYKRDTTVILKTTDGGINWGNTYVGRIDPYDSPFSIITLNEKRIVINLTGGFISSYLLSTDGGVTWNKKQVVNGTMIQIWNMIFTDSLNGYVCVGDVTNDTSITYRTSDGGESWDNVGPYYNGGAISMGDSINGVKLFISTLHFTNDGFITWESKPVPQLNLQSIFYVSCKAVYICGLNGYFAKSTDCGDTWTQIPFIVLEPTDVNERNNTITNYSLKQNYPNPFNPNTRINYNLISNNITTIKVYDILGKEIATLVNEYQISGSHFVDFNASELNSGVYFYKITSGAYTEVKKMLLMK